MKATRLRAEPQLVQKPCALGFHAPALLLPDTARGSRVICPSGVKVILNLTPLGVAAVKGWPLNNVAWMSLGAMGSAAKAALVGNVCLGRFAACYSAPICCFALPKLASFDGLPDRCYDPPKRPPRGSGGQPYPLGVWHCPRRCGR